MKILFLGGTGRLSKDVALRAADEKHEVYLVTRGSAERKIFVDPRYHMIYLDIDQYETAKKELAKYRFDVAVDFLSYDKDRLKKTLEMLDGICGQFVFISTATVYIPKEEEVIAEATTAIGNAAWAYSYHKYECEQFLKEYYANTPEVHYTIIRPYVTYGNTRVPYPIVPQDARLEWTLVDRVQRDLPVPTFDKGETVTTLMHTKDFAAALVGLFGNQAAYNEDFHIVNEHTTTWKAVLDCIGNKLEKDVATMDFTQAEIYGSMKEYKGILLGDKGRRMCFDTTKLQQALGGFASRVSLQKGVSDMIDFYTANPTYQLVDYQWDGRVDRLCGVGLREAVKKYAFHNARDVAAYLTGRVYLFYMAGKVYKKIRGIVHHAK